MNTTESEPDSEQLDAPAVETIAHAAETIAAFRGPLSGEPDLDVIERHLDDMARALGGRFHRTGEAPEPDLGELVAAADTSPGVSTAIDASELTLDADLDHANINLTEADADDREADPVALAFNNHGTPELSIEGELGEGYAGGSVSLDVDGCRRLAAQLLAVATEVEPNDDAPGYE